MGCDQMSHFKARIISYDKKMKLIIIEDEVILAEKYALYLKDIYEEIEIYCNFSDALNALNNESFDVCLVDYHLPDGTGLDIAKTLKNEPHAPVIVMITAYSKERLAIDSLNIGVYKYLEKPIEKDFLVQTMKECFEYAKKNETLRSLEVQFLITPHARKALAEIHALSPREIEVLEKTLIYGKNKLVGKELFISQGTIRNHLSTIYQKLHLTSKDQLREIVKKLNEADSLG
jgi:DNA-binding NarL/FixJ family response regulator